MRDRVAAASRPYYYLGSGRALTSLHDGAPFIVDTGDIGISTWIIRDGRWEGWVEPVFVDHCQPGTVVVDCGAHMGYYTIIAGRRIGRDGRIFSFEPNPRLFRTLRDNVFINGLDGRCTPVNCALGSAPGSTRMWFEERLPGGGYLSTDPTADRSAEGFQSCDVTVRRLDDVLPPDLAVGLMKVDVEGFEPAVFDGGWAVIDRSPRLTLIVELSPEAWRGQGFDPLAFLGQLTRRGFRFAIVTPDGVSAVSGPEELIKCAQALPYVSVFLATR